MNYLLVFIIGFIIPFIFKWIFKKLCYIDKSDIIENPISIEPVKVSKFNSIYRVNKNYIVDENTTIPEGFEFNGASIPGIFWDMIDHPYHSSYITAACIHDYRYFQLSEEIEETYNRLDDVISKLSMKKVIKSKYKEANKEFRDNIRKYNRKIVSELMYIAVNIYSNILCYFKLK
jgi:hypothetical protein